jgi:transposase InsO family protein
LEPVLEAMLRQFPFRIQGFHSDNGREFLNKTAARLLEKLRIEQTKSRPRRSNASATATLMPIMQPVGIAPYSEILPARA